MQRDSLSLLYVFCFFFQWLTFLHVPSKRQNKWIILHRVNTEKTTIWECLAVVVYFWILTEGQLSRLCIGLVYHQSAWQSNTTPLDLYRKILWILGKLSSLWTAVKIKSTLTHFNGVKKKKSFILSRLFCMLLSYWKHIYENMQIYNLTVYLICSWSLLFSPMMEWRRYGHLQIDYENI